MASKMKRENDFKILDSIETKMDGFALAINSLQIEVKSIKENLFKNNGKECMETRLKKTEDTVQTMVTTKQAMAVLVSCFVATVTFVLAIVTTLKAMNVIK